MQKTNATRILGAIIIILGIAVLLYQLNTPPQEPHKTYCTPESREGSFCTKEYVPVCGWFNASIQCIKYPCAITAGNACEACHSQDVAYWTPGICPQ